MAKLGENIYKRKDGRYEGRYVIGRTPEGRTKFGYVYGRQYAAVREELTRRRAAEADNRGYSLTGRMTFGEWTERWMQGELKANVKPSSYQAYLGMYSRHMKGEMGCRDITKITPDAIRAFLESLYKKGLADSTVKGVYRLFSAAMRCAQEEEVIRRNPCSRIRLKNAAQREQRVLNRRESDALNKNAHPQGDLPALMSLYTGMRLGEICGLRWDDVDWDSRTLTIRRCAQRIALSNSKQKTTLIIGTPKSLKSCRTLPVPDFIMDLLRARQSGSGGGYIFGTPDRAAEPRTIQRQFQRLAGRSGLTNVHFHTLRHSFATRLFELGVDVKTVSSLLGHSSARITLDFYAHSLLEHQRAAIDRLAAHG